MPFKYQPRAQDALQKREAELGGGTNGDPIFNRPVTEFKPQAGENSIRLCPPTWSNPDHYGFPMHIHYGVGPDRAQYLCLEKHLGKPDPVTEKHDILLKTDKRAANKLRCTERMAVWLIDLADVGKGVQLWRMPITVDRDIRRYCKDGNGNIALFPDNPDEGYAIHFYKDGEKLETRYRDVRLDRRPSPLSADPELKKQWLDFVLANPIPDMLNYYPYERIAAVLDSQLASTESAAPVEPQPPAATPTEPQPQTDAYAHVPY